MREIQPVFVQLGNAVRELVALVERKLALGNLESHQQRVIRRMAVIALGSQLADEIGVIPIDKDQVLSAALSAIYGLVMTTTSQKAFEGSTRFVNSFCIVKIAFARPRMPAPVVHLIVGYKTSEGGTTGRLYLFTPEQFSEIYREHRCNSTEVVKEVKKRQLLYVNETRWLASKHGIEAKW